MLSTSAQSCWLPKACNFLLLLLDFFIKDQLSANAIIVAQISTIADQLARVDLAAVLKDPWLHHMGFSI